MRSARLGLGRDRLPVPAESSRDRPGLAGDAPRLLEIWRLLAPDAPPPEACLINLYDANAKMGLHQDRDEQELAAPVVSVSLGDSALFRLGGRERGDRTRSLKLQSGDAIAFGGPARLAFHGIDRITPGSSTLLAEGGRINLTLRRVSRSE